MTEHFSDKEPAIEPIDEPVAVGEVLDDLNQVITSRSDPARVKNIERVSLEDEVADLTARRDILAETIRAGDDSPGLKVKLEEANSALLAAQAEKIAAGGQYPTDQPDN